MENRWKFCRHCFVVVISVGNGIVNDKLKYVHWQHDQKRIFRLLHRNHSRIIIINTRTITIDIVRLNDV